MILIKNNDSSKKSLDELNGKSHNQVSSHFVEKNSFKLLDQEDR